MSVPCTCDRQGAIYGANPEGHQPDCPGAPNADYYRAKLRGLLDAAAPPVSRRDCMCPQSNPDCEHPTCPRWPQPGHFAVQAAEVVEQWETGGEGYADLEQRIAVALAEAAKQ